MNDELIDVRTPLAASANVRIELGTDGTLHVVTPQLTLHLDRAHCEELTTTLARGLVRLHKLELPRARPNLRVVPADETADQKCPAPARGPSKYEEFMTDSTIPSYSPKAFVGRQAPSFTLPSTKNLSTLGDPVSLADYKGKWLVMLFYPLDFTFVCPTELRGFSERHADFEKEGAAVLGVSVDSVHTHRAWLEAAPDKGGLGSLRFPLASDITHSVSKDYGVFLEDQGHSLRGTFVIGPDGVLRSSVINDLDVGRSVDETLRTIRAFKTGGLCPVDWKPGQATLKPGR